MGYYTNYDITVENGKANAERTDDIIRWLEANSDYGVEFKLHGNGWLFLCESKWHTQEDDMNGLSIAFPDILFCVHGEGDGSGDVWNEYWQNGFYQTCKAEIPPYDPEKMSLWDKEVRDVRST